MFFALSVALISLCREGEFVLLLPVIMKTLFIGKNCIRLEETDSTNSYLTRIASEKDLPEGTVAVARAQEQGKGQRGTRWESDRDKNLTLSILLKPRFLKPDEQFMLSKAVALGVREFIYHSASPFPRLSVSTKEADGKICIKWPNDIYIGSKKIAGILIENSVNGNSLSQSVAGIGININQEHFSAALPNPTSLKVVAGKEFDLEECLEGVCSCIEGRYLLLRQNDFSKIDSEYLRNLYRFGEWAKYKHKDKELNAKITGVTKAGKLILETETKEMLECEMKEVKFC